MKIFIGILIFGLFFSASGFAECTQKNRDQATQTTIKSWDDAYHWFQFFKQCVTNDAEIAEFMDDFVVRLFANYWTHFQRFLDISKNTPSFQELMISHIGSTANLEDLNNVARNAQRHCPKNALELCKSIARKAIMATKEL